MALFDVRQLEEPTLYIKKYQVIVQCKEMIPSVAIFIEIFVNSGTIV